MQFLGQGFFIIKKWIKNAMHAYKHTMTLYASDY